VPALIRLRDRHPNLSFELITATRQLNLHQAGFDLAIAVGDPTSSRLFTERLTHYTLAPYASEDYLARRGAPADLEELKAHTLVFYIDSLVQVGDLDLNQYAPGVTARFTSTNILAQLEATRLGAGVGLLPRFLASGVPELVALSISGLKTIRLSFTLAARRDSVTRPAVQAVRAALHQEVKLRQNELLDTEMEYFKRRTRNGPSVS
jgi:DNA-binding transcriptional LysR family regulator